MSEKQLMNMWKAMVATKQLEIDKLKRKIKELETKIKEMENDTTRPRTDPPRKKAKRTTDSSDSDK